MTRQQQNEFIEEMYHTYIDFENVVRSEGIKNVFEDIENLHPDLYSMIIQEVTRRAKIKVNGVLLTKDE